MLAVGQGEGVAALVGGDPQLVPLPAQVRGIGDAPAVRGPVGARLPGGLLVADLARLAAGLESQLAITGKILRAENQALVAGDCPKTLNITSGNANGLGFAFATLVSRGLVEKTKLSRAKPDIGAFPGCQPELFPNGYVYPNDGKVRPITVFWLKPTMNNVLVARAIQGEDVA